MCHSNPKPVELPILKMASNGNKNLLLFHEPQILVTKSVTVEVEIRVSIIHYNNKTRIFKNYSNTIN